MENKNFSEIILNSILLIIGVCLVMWADKVTNLVSIILGILAIIYGIVMFINYFKNNARTGHDTLVFVYGIIVLVIGLILVFRVDFLKELVSFIVGIYIFLTSILKLQEILSLKKNTSNKFKTSVILAIIGIFIGIMCIVGKFLIPDIMIVFVGIMLIVYSVINIANLIIIKREKLK